MDENEPKKDENELKNNKENSNDESEKYLLPPKSENKINLKTLVLDLDETLAHGQNTPFSSPKNQLSIECKLNDINTTIYFKIRPGVKEFLRKMNKLYEIVIFTASVEEYAKILINLIDTKNVCSYKLYREQCTYENSLYIKDLTKLGRDLKDVVIIDNSPNAYSLNKENGIPISTWLEDENDRELYDLIQILEFLSYVDDVRTFIPKFVIGDEISFFASMDIIKKYKNFNFTNSNLSAINFHPFMNDSSITNQITENNNHSIIVENTINKDESKNKLNEEMKKEEKDLIEYSENLFDDVILNETINRTDFDININTEISILKNDDEDKNDKSKLEIKNEENNNKISGDNKKINTKEINNLKEEKENINIEKNDKNNKSKEIKDNNNKSISKTKSNKNQKKKKGKTISNKNKNNIREIKHNKSSSLVMNTISNLNLLMPYQKQRKENMSKNKMNLTIKSIKSKTIKRQKKIKLEEDNSKKKYIRPRNIISEFKPLKTLNNSTESLFNKNKFKIISYTPKKVKNSDKNKLKNRILTQMNQNKEKDMKENSKLNNTIKAKNNIEKNKKELIKQRKKTPFRVHPKKEKQNNISKINNKTLKEMTDKEKSNKIINYRNKNSDSDLKKENISLIKSKNNEHSTNKQIINNHKAAKSTKHFHIKNNNVKKIENRLPWGWGGYTIKLSDFDNIFNYNVESREIRIAKLDLDSFKRAKSYKPSKIEKSKINKDSKDNNIKMKRGKSSSSSTNITINKTDNNK